MLIVDDERIERKGLESLVGRCGLPLECETAENGQAALQKMECRQFDLLLTDIKMPFMDGLTLAHEARKRFPEMVIIILSAYRDFEKAQSAINEQVYRYLLKLTSAEPSAVKLPTGLAEDIAAVIRQQRIIGNK